MIQGRGFVLKLATQADFMAVLQIAGANADQLFWDRGEISLDDVFGTLLASDPGTVSRLWCVWKDQKVVGFVALSHISAVHRSAEIAYLGIHPDHASPWLASAIVDATLEFGFETLGLHRINGKVFASHSSLLKLYKRKGFRQEGEQKDVVYRKGGFEGFVLFGMLEDEWKARKCQ